MARKGCTKMPYATLGQARSAILRMSRQYARRGLQEGLPLRGVQGVARHGDAAAAGRRIQR